MPAAPYYNIRPAATDHHLEQILALQAANLREHLNTEERQSQGFVSLRHNLSLLREMNRPYPHVIATTLGANGEEELVGYALVMLPAFRARLPLLEPMFAELARVEWRGRALDAWRWYVMGQVCVAKAHRGRGLVERMYDAHRSQMSPHFDVMITEIDRANPRSMRAHERAGFEVVREYRGGDGREWVIVGLGLDR
jgi:hypothetical protein